jgi:hypothetical protein
VVASNSADGDPGYMLQAMQAFGCVAATPTLITASVALCSMFMLPAALTVNKIRFYGVGATTNVYRVAIYRLSDLARLTAELPFSTSSATWGAAGSALNLSLLANVPYFTAIAVNATGTTAGVGCFGPGIAATTGQIQTTPANLPGSLAATAGKISAYQFQFAVTAGALPATAATLTFRAAVAIGQPAFFMDNSNV